MEAENAEGRNRSGVVGREDECRGFGEEGVDTGEGREKDTDGNRTAMVSGSLYIFHYKRADMPQ